MFRYSSGENEDCWASDTLDFHKCGRELQIDSELNDVHKNDDLQ